MHKAIAFYVPKKHHLKDLMGKKKPFIIAAKNTRNI